MVTKMTDVDENMYNALGELRADGRRSSDIDAISENPLP
jgi:hypothetical protein